MPQTKEAADPFYSERIAIRGILKNRMPPLSC